jgi:hypothetical protein
MSMDNAPEVEIEDDKNIITDIAFGVDDALLGKPLASPLRRGFAIAIDAFFVLMLTHVSAVVASIVAGAAVFKFGKKSEQKRWRFTRFLLRLTGGMMVFVSTLVILDNSFDDSEFKNTEIKVDTVDSFANSIKLGATVVSLTNKLEQGDCERACYHPLVEDVLDALLELKVPEDEIYEFINENTSELPFESEEERLEYVAELYEYYQNALISKSSTNSDLEVTAPDSILPSAEPLKTETDDKYYQGPNDKLSTTKEENTKANKEEKPVYSFLEFAKGIIADLGLGFGWAALYFTAFPAWWKGQTPGKKLMGIRVVQLDGTYMSAWESFGRYGGYGAGFATGLLGFFQIYWDSNRQAIQDKISATVVIKGDL